MGMLPKQNRNLFIVLKDISSLWQECDRNVWWHLQMKWLNRNESWWRCVGRASKFISNLYQLVQFITLNHSQVFTFHSELKTFGKNMNQQGLFGFWFYLLSMCVLVYHGQAQVPEPAQCLLSGTYNLTQQPVEGEDEGKCWRDCYTDPDCHMAVIVIPLRDRKQCLLVNCLNQGRHSYTRDPRTQIRVYPKTTIDNGRMDSCFLLFSDFNKRL